jgi:hypothetical protein
MFTTRKRRRAEITAPGPYQGLRGDIAYRYDDGTIDIEAEAHDGLVRVNCRRNDWRPIIAVDYFSDPM